jgi:hypothetical protein
MPYVVGFSQSTNLLVVARWPVEKPDCMQQNLPQVPSSEMECQKCPMTRRRLLIANFWRFRFYSRKRVVLLHWRIALALTGLRGMGLRNPARNTKFPAFGRPRHWPGWHSPETIAAETAQ